MKPFAGPPDGANSLNDGGPWPRHLARLIGDHLQIPRKSLQQLVWPQQEIRIARFAETFIAAGEGLIDQRASGREARCNPRQQWPVQVIDHDNSAKQTTCERPGSGFDVGGDNLEFRPLRDVVQPG
jgi:hypothetical protein